MKKSGCWWKRACQFDANCEIISTGNLFKLFFFKWAASIENWKNYKIDIQVRNIKKDQFWSTNIITVF
jgi:hypothetical protein